MPDNTVYGAGQLVNATNGYPNAYTGEVESFDSAHTLSPTMKTYYNTTLLKNAKPEMVYDQFAKKQVLPKNHGINIEWRKFLTIPVAKKLTEGVIPSGEKFGQIALTDVVDQYGTYAAVSDRLETHAIDPVIQSLAEEMGNSAGNTKNTLQCNDVTAGTSVMYAKNKSGDTETAVSTRAQLDGSAVMTGDLVSRAATWLKRRHAPKIDGVYVCVIHPDVAYDLKKDPTWRDVHTYATPENMFTGELGMLHGVRFVESADNKVFKAEDLTDDSRTLKVGSYSSKVITLATDADNQLTSDQAAALVGRKIVVKSQEFTIASATAYAAAEGSGAATAATITIKETPAVNPSANDVVYPGGGNSVGGNVYASMFIGYEAYGTVDAEGCGLEMIVKTKEQVGGPLDQFGTVGYKMESNGAKILYEERLLRVETSSSYAE